MTMSQEQFATMLQGFLTSQQTMMQEFLASQRNHQEHDMDDEERDENDYHKKDHDKLIAKYIKSDAFSWI